MPIMNQPEAELLATARAWDAAMITNDADAIGRFMSDDWIIVGPDGSVGGKAPFLALIASGDLTHDTMTSDEVVVRVHGDSATIIARGVSGGAFKGQAFRETESSSNVFVLGEGRWRCVLTHLSRLPSDDGRDGG